MSQNRLNGKGFDNANNGSLFAQEIALAIDRLVTGDLGEVERNKIVRWMEAEPSRWRQFGISVLEAQSWEESFREATTPSSRRIEFVESCRSDSNSFDQVLPEKRVVPVVLPMESQHPGSPQGNERSWRIHSGVLLAGLLCLMFAAGWQSRSLTSSNLSPGALSSNPSSPVDPKSEGSAKTEESQKEFYSEQRVELVSLNVPGAEQMKMTGAVVFDREGLPPAPEIAEEDREIWGRHGFELRTERRYFPAKLASGASVVVPVDRVVPRYIGVRMN